LRSLVFAEAARRDVEEAVAFIARDDPAAAGRMVDRIEAVAAMLLSFPRAGAALSRERRVIGVGGTPFRLIYRETRGGITILRVWHGARGWPPAR
jgi:toxin ParE1/3/4